MQTIGVKRARALSPSSSRRLSVEAETTANLKKALKDKANPFDLSNKENISDATNASETNTAPFADLKSLVIEVEGNIGSGKSTLTEMMTRHINSNSEDKRTSIVFGEKVNNTFLGAFYRDIKKYSFAFQMYMLTTRLYQMEESSRLAKTEDRLVFLDRGAVGDSLFALLNYQMSNMGDEEMKVYKSVCQERMPRTISDKVDMVLYLDVDPAECHRRVTSLRKNKAEDGIPLSYLEAVDSTYFHLFMDWLAGRKGGFHDMNIGAAPPITVFRWDRYGSVDAVLAALSALRTTKRRSPTVNFVRTLSDVAEVVSELVIESDKDMDAAYHLLVRTGSPVTVSQSSTRSICVNWGITHSNAFRRVVMYYMSECGDILFYGDATAPPGPLRSSTPVTSSSSAPTSPSKAEFKSASPSPSSPMSTGFSSPSPTPMISTPSFPRADSTQPMASSSPTKQRSPLKLRSRRSPSPITIDSFDGAANP